MKRTISNKVLLRMAAQADEADVYNDVVVSNHLTNQIEKFAEIGVRADTEEYEYSKEDLLEDVKEHLWDIFSRVCDYFEEVPDGKEVEEVLSFEAETLLENLENLIHGNVGAHEVATPGEEVGEELFEVSDDFVLNLDGDEEDDEDSDEEDDPDEMETDDEEDEESDEEESDEENDESEESDEDEDTDDLEDLLK